MARASLKLVVLTLGFLILSVFAVYFMRQTGLRQVFAEPPHPWFQKPFWWVYSPSVEELCAAQFSLPGSDWIVEIPIKRKEQDWQIPCAKPILLSDFLKQTPLTEIMLKIQAHDTWALDKLVEIAAPFDNSKRFAVTTDAQKVSIYLRKKAPQWLFAAESATLLRLRMFESLWLETAVEFWPDFVISSFSHKDSLQIDERMAQELDRRKKRILFRWEEGVSEDPHVPIHGIMTNRPGAAQQKFGTRL